MAVRLQAEVFDIGVEVGRLIAGRTDVGAVATFVGICRADGESGPITAMTLEHYPALAEAELARLEADARARWPLQEVLIVHRFGRLVPGDPIVLVAALSPHREAAFEAATFLMDVLKTRAPFWKREEGVAGSVWVEAKVTDEAAAGRWQ